MAPVKDVDEQLKYLLLVIKNSEFKPNYRALAEDAGVNNANNAQKFKKLAENGGFALINGAVVLPDENKDTGETPKKQQAKKAATPASKKRKVEEVMPKDEVNSDEAAR